MYKTVALLPMKANSERVPGKNFRCIAGKPLYRWILDNLLAVSAIEKIIINTDAEQLLQAPDLVNDERILLRPRATSLCGDFVSMNHIIADDLQAVAADSYVMTHATQPLLTSKTIAKALQCFSNLPASYDSLFSVTKHLARFYQQDLTPINHDPNDLIRTQDLPPLFEENSCLYLFSRQSFAKTKARIGETPFMFECPKLETIDIDDQEDWLMAEALLCQVYNKS